MESEQPKDLFSVTLPVLREARNTLLSAHEFHRLCQSLEQAVKEHNIYFFVAPIDLDLPHYNNRFWQKNIVFFFDYLADIIINRKPQYRSKKMYFFLQKVRIWGRKKQDKFRIQKKSTERNSIKISVEIIGEGMIGRVARIKVNQGETLAFKAFFDSNLVWTHGPWGEIPVGIYLQANHVTKDLPELKLASKKWLILEWIYPDFHPSTREGINYNELSKRVKLTPLNYLNQNNYNPHNIRLDMGGIQKEYFGRRWHDFGLSIIFYTRKIRREGLSFLTVNLNLMSLMYIFLRIGNLLLPRCIKTKLAVENKNGSDRKLENSHVNPLSK